jgi:UDP-4-amino-4,6-dideoxy-N-acetyl-beta-L-altrosamine transaminase
VTSRFIPYGRQLIDRRDIAAVTRVLRSPFLTQGPAVEEFESRLRERVGAKYCVAVANGTAALHLAVAALELPAGSEGITSANTFAASANAMAYCGLRPVLADIESRTGNISVPDLRLRLTRKTRVLIPVHFAGQPADMPAIGRIARRAGLRVIEDAAHALGSRCADGSRVGSCRHSHLTAFSFHPVKTITTGEGGAVTTNDPELYRRLCDLRSHGIVKDPGRLQHPEGPWYYEMQSLGFNYRLTDIGAALGSSQLEKLDSFVARRRRIVSAYNRSFRRLRHVRIPWERPGVFSAFHLYVLLIDFAALGKTRTQVMDELRERGIGTQVHYIPVHLQPYYRERFGYRPGAFPAAEARYAESLSLPLYPAMTDADTARVIRTVREVLA